MIDTGVMLVNKYLQHIKEISHIRHDIEYGNQVQFQGKRRIYKL